ncbi:MAG: hypothetical protein JNK27_12235 [Chitinophagaceae bacterium]|nr:hypothetical protein [Chitinophagaceae bacterium]
MKWMEPDFLYKGTSFSIIGLEISYPLEKVQEILKGIDHEVQTTLSYHLYFDYAFMSGVYPGIAALCMMGSQKSGSIILKKALIVLALLQLVAFYCDIKENGYLFKWLNDPVTENEFQKYHIIVVIKWVIALTGALLAIPFALRKRKQGS